jgi:hypothetical protein
MEGDPTIPAPATGTYVGDVTVETVRAMAMELFDANVDRMR